MEPELKLKANQPIFENCYSREVTILRAKNIDESSRTIRGILATELPAIVFDWSKWRIIREIILVNGMEVPKKIPLLDAHSRFQTSNIKGSTINPEKLDDPKLGSIIEADNVFSATAENEWTLAKEGHLDSTSIGYEIFPEHSIEVLPGTETVIKGMVYKNDYSDKLPLVIRIKSRVFENSLVPIGADKAAKFRSVFNEEFEIKTAGSKQLLEEIKKANQILIENKIEIEKLNQKRSTLNMTEIEVKEERERNETSRVSAINQLTADFKDKVKGINLETVKALFIAGERSVKDFSDEIFKNIKEQAAVAKPTIELNAKEKKQYSLFKGAMAFLNKTNSFELEISKEYAEKSGLKPEGFFMPHFGKRDLQATAAAAGAEFVATEHLGGEFIDALRNETAAGKFGIQFLPGRKGNIEIPKLSTGATFGWATTENAVLTESSPVTTEITLTPKRGGTWVDVSKQAVIQGDPSVEQVVINDLRQTLAIGIDKAVFHGSGASGQPSGIAVLATGAVSAASASWASMLEFISDVKAANANLGEMKYAFNPVVEAALRAREKSSGYPVYIMTDDDKIAGYGTVVSNQINDGYIMFGAGNCGIVALWDAVDITIDPYTLATYHLVRITANQLMDFAVRHGLAFTVASDFS